MRKTQLIYEELERIKSALYTLAINQSRETKKMRSLLQIEIEAAIMHVSNAGYLNRNPKWAPTPCPLNKGGDSQ